MKILYENEDILVIDKPSGVSVHPAKGGVHPDGRNKEETIVDWFVKNYPEARDVGEPIFSDGEEIKRSGVVHRLDKDTSGVLVLVKNKKAHEFIKKQFQDREIKKTYITIVNGWPKNDHGTIDKPIGRSPSDFRRRLAGRGARGELREAVTEYKVLKRFTTSTARFEDKNNKFSILEVYPRTGRTHQIRVHLKYLNYPIVCDPLYNPKGIIPEGISRLGLHAKSIEFTNLAGEKIKVESSIPEEFKNFFKK